MIEPRSSAWPNPNFEVSRQLILSSRSAASFFEVLAPFRAAFILFQKFISDFRSRFSIKILTKKRFPKIPNHHELYVKFGDFFVKNRVTGAVRGHWKSKPSRGVRPKSYFSIKIHRSCAVRDQLNYFNIQLVRSPLLKNYPLI